LVEFLQDHLDTRIENITLADAIEKSLKNQCHFDVDNRQLMFLVNAPTTTRRFQMMRVAAELTCMPQLEHYLNDNRLITEASRSRARLALASYIAGAALLPYDEFLDTTEAYRYDVEKLRQKYQAGYEQICHRLITLRRPLAEGVPFAFLRVDPSGHISKRFPLYGLPLPRYGHACPLWNVFTAFQTPSRVVRQLSEFPDGRRFLMIARTVTKRPAAFHAPPVMYAIMLACDKLHADRTIYSEGLDFEAPGTAIPVGPSCRMCNYTRCQQRQEDSLYSGLN